MPTVLRIARKRKIEDVSPEAAPAVGNWDVGAMLLQTLIPCAHRSIVNADFGAS